MHSFVKIRLVRQTKDGTVVGDVKGFASTYDTQTEKVNTRNQVKTAGSPGKSRLKLLVQKYIPSSQTVTGGAGLPTHSSLEYKEGYVHTQG